MSNRKPKVVDRHSGNYVFEGAPKACFGRKLNTEREACIGKPGRSNPCAFMEPCSHCVEARVKAGITDENDMSLPTDYVIPAQFVAAPPAAKPAKGAAVLRPTDWHDYLPESPAQTTIGQAELAVAESKLLDNERKYVRTSFGYFREQGRILADVYGRMSSHEFRIWCSRANQPYDSARRYVALWCSTKDLGEQEPALLDNPKLTARRMELLLANSQGLDLPVLLGARVEDGKGATCSLLDVPAEELGAAIAQLKRRLDVAPEVDGMLARAEAKDRSAAGTDRERVHREPTGGADEREEKPDEGQVVPVPFQPLSLLLPLWREAKVWEVSGRPRLVGPLGAHTDKQVKQLKGARDSLAGIVEDLDGVLDKLAPKS